MQHRTVIVLVHGSWHGGWCFERVTPHLVQQGYRVVAPDLPGHGRLAHFPESYFQRPLPQPGAFNVEPSPVGAITLDDYTRHIIGLIDEVTEETAGRVVLVGHSLAGIILNAVGERLGPKRIKRLVYVSAWMPAHNTPIGAYIASPTQFDSKIPPLLLASPTEVGALRVDPRSVDPAYQALMRGALYADVDEPAFPAIANLLTPDDPAQPFGAVVPLSCERWGRVPRAYICCTEDQAIRPATQAQMIADADAFALDNPTEVIALPSGHSPFFSQPETLAVHLAALAG